MGKNLKSLADFAAMLNMQYRYVKRACVTVLKEAVVGDHIDMDHDCVLQYIKRRKTEPAHVETDANKPMYERAIDACQKTGLWSIKNIRKNLPVGDKKAATFLDKMKESGLVPDDYDKSNARSIATNNKPKPVKRPESQHVKKQEPKPVKLSEPVKYQEPNLKQADSIKEFSTRNVPLPEHIAKYGHKSLYELVDIFGSDLAFFEWLRGCKMMEEVIERQRKNAEAMSVLVNQEVFKIGVIEPIDMFLKQILTDGADNIVQRLRALTNAGCDDVECKKYFVDVVNSFIRPMKSKMMKTFKD